MKRNLFYLLPLLLTLGVACSPKSDPVVIPNPTGAFTGTFKLITKKTTGTGYDTAKSNIVLTTTSSAHYAVTGDTTKHAGSKGLYIYDGNFIQFRDSTYKVGVQTKTHLAGVYQYLYDGVNFKMIAGNKNVSPDTIYRYDLLKQ
ncbi:hypothetical protein [Mucilaginibacter pineti]|nr:hypothetical protein [Mucilaginibacter pineti]